MPKFKAYFYTLSQNTVIGKVLLAIDIILRGISQVFLCDHPLCGILISIGLILTSYELFLYAVWGTIFSTVGAYLIGTASMDDIRSGLCGYEYLNLH
jgi:urea transporter